VLVVEEVVVVEVVVVPAAPGAGAAMAGMFGCTGRAKGFTFVTTAVVPGAPEGATGIVPHIVATPPSWVATPPSWFVTTIGVIPGPVVTVVSLVTVVLPAGSVAGCVCDSVTVVVVVLDFGTMTSVPGATVGSSSRLTGEYCAWVGDGTDGGGFGCEHETRQIAKNTVTSVFIFYSD